MDNVRAEIRKMRAQYYDSDKTLLGMPVSYDSLDDIENNLKSGRFRVELEGWDFEGIFKGKSGTTLTVIYTGSRDVGTPPNFPRWSYHNLFNGSMLCLDDPMYHKYPELRLGWFYGTKERSLLELSTCLIQSVCRRLGIEEKDVIFFSSSGGGYAGIYASSLMDGTISISLNPQLYIQNHDFNGFKRNFESVTGYALSDEDKLNRNNIVKQIKNDGSKHIILFNVQSEFDWDFHAKPFCNEMQIIPKYGIVEKDNVLFWTFDCDGAPYPHNTWETKSIFLFIDYIAKKFKHGTVTPLLENAVLIVNECWHDIYSLKKELVSVNAELVKKKTPSISIVSGTISEGDSYIFAATRCVTIKAQDNNYNYERYNIEYPFSIYEIDIRDIEADFEYFTVGVFNFKNNSVEHYETFSTREQVKFSFLIGKNVDGLAICIYAGIFGKTRHLSIRIGSFTVKVRPLVSRMSELVTGEYINDIDVHMLQTAHKTRLYMTPNGHLIHTFEDRCQNHFPVYAYIKLSFLYMFFVTPKGVSYIQEIQEDGRIKKSVLPYAFVIMQNVDRTFSIRQKYDYISAGARGHIALTRQNNAWEHFTLKDDLDFNDESKSILDESALWNPSVMDIESTLSYINEKRVSCARFGDGEFCFLLGKGGDIGFQKYNRELANLLLRTACCEDDNILLCVPFGNLEQMKAGARNFWTKEMSAYGNELRTLFPRKYIFGNTQISRFYGTLEDEHRIERAIGLWKNIFAKKNICIIEGELSRLGVGNDFFDTAQSVKRILAPAKNAFSVHEKIVDVVCRMVSKDTLLLLALGPTATILVPIFAHMGFWAIDAGHVDVEYEWYRMKATQKVALRGKYVNEAGGMINGMLADEDEMKYKLEIIATIR